MNYVMADIHGQFDKYKKMLEMIQFSDDDILYVLGDVIDRGPDGLKILQDMMLRVNVIPILGNHEYMAVNCLAWLMREVTDESVDNIDAERLRGITEWMSVGGDKTIEEFRSLSQEEREDILDYLSEFGLYEVVYANGETFILVHAGLDNFTPDRDLYDYDLSELIFNKPDYEKEYFLDKYLVTGHVPTMGEIMERNRHIAIDCGAGFGGKLGCICLETGEKYYAI